MSKTAILWISSAEKRSLEKFSIGPLLWTNRWSEPILAWVGTAWLSIGYSSEF